LPQHFFLLFFFAFFFPISVLSRFRHPVAPRMAESFPEATISSLRVRPFSLFSSFPSPFSLCQEDQ
jgi:hypothetical protein